MSDIAIKDQLGYLLAIPTPPKRIVSLVPSQTEFLYSLGLDSEVIGITKYCVHPAHWLTSKTIVGGTKNFDIEKVTSLSPDLIIGNKEENSRESIDLLRLHFPVWISDVISFSDAFDMMEKIGIICDRHEQAQGLISQIKSSIDLYRKPAAQSALYLIWGKPWMVAGKQTFINEMLSLNGLVNLADGRYPEMSLDQIIALKPENVLLSSEPFPFKKQHYDELKKVLPDSKILFVDGEMFSWYGSRMLAATDYFRTIKF